MNFIFGFLLGLLIGWIIELIIDWRFWRQDDDLSHVGSNDTEALQNELSAAQAKISNLEAALAKASDTDGSSSDGSASVPATSADESKADAADRLEQIRGIGKVFASRFNDAGVFTFAQLAELTPDQVTDIVGVSESWRKIEPESWIAEAAELSKKS